MKNALGLLASASSLFFFGCVSTPSSVTSRPLVETRVDLRHSGRVAVVAFSSAAEVNMLMPANKTEAARDASDSIRMLNRSEIKSVARASGGEPILAAGLARTKAKGTKAKGSNFAHCTSGTKYP